MVPRNHPQLDQPDLRRLRRRAAAILWAEAVLGALAPAAAVLLCYILAALFSLGNPYLFAAILLLAAILLGYGLWHLRRPSQAAIDARIEVASKLRHRPLTDLTDTPALSDPASLELWQAHQARIAASLKTARAGPLKLNAAAHDKLALRALLMLGLLVGIVMAGATAPARIAGAFTLPPWPWPGPRITAWVTPPAYTGQPPHILNPGEAYATLTGAKLTIVTDGPRHPPAIHFGAAHFTDTALSETSHRADATIAGSDTLTIGPWWHRLASWRLTAAAPAAPSLAITSATIQRGNVIALHWHATDPYGLQSVTLVFTPTGHPGSLDLRFPLTTQQGDHGVLVDVTRSPFSGAPVTLTVIASNIAGATTAASPPTSLTVPGLQPHDPTAAALITNRRDIATTPADAQHIATALKQLSNAPPSKITAAADLQIAGLAATIRLGATTVPAVVDRLLALATEIESGPDYQPARQLAASTNALTQALAKGLNGSPPSARDLQKLLDAMHAAAAAHIGALQQAAGQTPANGATQPLNLSSLDALARQIAADEAAGNLQKAAQELQQLQQTLAALQSAQPMSPAQLAQAKAANAAAQSIAEMTQSQANLLDATNAGTATPAAEQALQNQLNATAAALKAAGLQIPGLTPAGAAMHSATKALTSHAGDSAASAETAAIKNLQAAAAALAQAAQRQFAISPMPGPGSQSGSGGITGMPDEQSNPNFNPNSANPAAAIQQQIIKQDSQPALPAATHDYYHRLLDPSP